MEEKIPSLYSKTLITKSCTYFFDVKKAKNESKYLTITESKINKDGQKYRATVMVFGNNLKEFLAAFEETVNKM